MANTFSELIEGRNAAILMRQNRDLMSSPSQLVCCFDKYSFSTTAALGDLLNHECKLQGGLPGYKADIAVKTLSAQYRMFKV